jgi:hypothetical protein
MMRETRRSSFSFSWYVVTAMFIALFNRSRLMRVLPRPSHRFLFDSVLELIVPCFASSRPTRFKHSRKFKVAAKRTGRRASVRVVRFGPEVEDEAKDIPGRNNGGPDALRETSCKKDGYNRNGEAVFTRYIA